MAPGATRDPSAAVDIEQNGKWRASFRYRNVRGQTGAKFHAFVEGCDLRRLGPDDPFALLRHDVDVSAGLLDGAGGVGEKGLELAQEFAFTFRHLHSPPLRSSCGRTLGLLLSTSEYFTF